MTMIKLLACLVLVIVPFVCAQDTSVAEVKAAFEAANIPDDLGIVFDPKYLLDIKFPTSATSVKAGVRLTQKETSTPPAIAVSGDITRIQRLILTMLDLDAPTPEMPTDAQVRHLLAGNLVRTVESHDDPKELMLLTRPVSRWHDPAPPPGSPPHRFVFLLYDQPRNFIRQNILTVDTPITNFNISQFSQEMELGDPIAGTYMLVGPETSFSAAFGEKASGEL